MLTLLRLKKTGAWPHINQVLRQNFYQSGHKSARTLFTSEHFLSKDNVSETTSLKKRWKETADTVIIGGGVIGVSLAYHLSKFGAKDVVLLEKLELTSGSTWHAAGLTTAYHPGINIKKLHFYSLQLYETLESETGQEVGYHKCGSVRLAKDETRMDEFRYQMARQGWNDAEQLLITPDEIQELLPIMNCDGIIGGLYTPNDGHIDPYSLTQALAIGARHNGADIYQNAPVTKLTNKSDGSWEIQTPEGTMTAQRIVNCGGFHAREIGKLAGADHPLVPVDHQYCVTKSIPEVQMLKEEIPVIRDLDGSYYLRMERDGLLFGPYEHEEKMRLCDDWYDQVPPEFGKELFQPDIDRIMENIEVAMELFPCLKTAEIQQTVSGPITYAPENLPLIGPFAGIPNYWTAIGMAYGIVHGGGIGKYLAEWIINDEPTYDLVELDNGRYGKWTDRAYTLSKARESYGWNNAMGYPREERPKGRPSARNIHIADLQKLQIERGAHHNNHTGWEQPEWFSLPGDEPGYKPSFRRTNWFKPMLRECELVMNKVGIIDLTPFGKIRVKGPDAAKFMDHISANTLPEVGLTNISHMLTPRGRVFSELTVTRKANDEFLCITGSGSELHDFGYMLEKARIWGYNVGITNISDDYGVLSVAGPRARDVMSNLTEGDFSNEAFPFLTGRDITVGDVDVHAIRISYTGELGWEMYMKIGDTSKVYKSLLEAGSSFEIGDFGTLALNVLRIEKGFRMWGNEMNVDRNPIEAGLGIFIKHNKEADFIGKKAVTKIKNDGVENKLVFLNVDTSDVDPEGNETVWYNNKVVGMTTSGTFSLALQKSIAMAYLPKELSKTGQKVEVEILGSMCPAHVQKSAPMLTEPMRVRAGMK